MASSSKQVPAPPVSPPGSAQHWEGDGTLHSYCYDYMRKRGWTETAAAFAADAGIDENEWKGPPIEAPQGLLYEWWSVFWDVFIARSQKTGHRNVMADTYVEAMRSKRDPLIVQFAGMPGTPPIALPRSLAHPARTASGPLHPPPTPNPSIPIPPGTPSGQRPSYSGVPGQMLAIQQQQIQDQLQGRGMPPPGPGGRPGALSQQSYHAQSQPQGSGPPPAQSPASQGPAYPPNPSLQQQHVLQSYPGQPQQQASQQASQPSSSHSSPHVSHTPHPYANGTGGVNGAANGRLGAGPGQPSPTAMSQPLLQAMAAIGLSGRDPASLTPEEEVAVQNQMRRLGVMPATPAQQQYYRSQQQAQAQAQVQQQQQLQHQQHQQQHQQQQQMAQMQQMQQMQQQQQQLQLQRPALPRAHSDQPRAPGQFPPGSQQQHLHERQLLQQQMMQQQVQLQQQQLRGEPRDHREQLQRHQQMAYASSQVGSPSSPAYSAGASPYATPLQSHMLPPQSTAGAVLSPATAGKGRGGGVIPAKASPVPPKRGGIEDPSPRGRKRARGSIKDEDQAGVAGAGPRTPRFEMGGSGPPSPAMGIGAPLPGIGSQFTVPLGQAYLPTQSPSLGHDPATRGALDAIQIGASTSRITAQHQQEHEDSLNGDASMHGSLGGNGSLSRPGSSASNYLVASNSYINNASVDDVSPNTSSLSSRPPSVAGNNPVPNDLYPNPTPHSVHPPLHISIPAPLPPGAFQLVNPADATPGGSRPFAGAHPLISTPAPQEPNGVTPQPGNPTDGFQYMAGGAGSGSGGNDLFSDLSGLDFSLDSFIDHDLFNDKDEHLEVSLV